MLICWWHVNDQYMHREIATLSLLLATVDNLIVCTISLWVSPPVHQMHSDWGNPLHLSPVIVKMWECECDTGMWHGNRTWVRDRDLSHAPCWDQHKRDWTFPTCLNPTHPFKFTRSPDTFQHYYKISGGVVSMKMRLITCKWITSSTALTSGM